MDRRTILLGLSAFGAASVAGCATTPPAAPFSSTRISVETRGNGPDVILVPGLSSHRSVWDTTVAAFDTRFRFHLVQVNGFAGFPAEGNAEGPVAAPVAEEIVRYVAETRLDRPALIGHSMGGSIGMMAAARHPEALSKLMVVDMLPFMGAMFGPPGTTPDSVRPIADAIGQGMLSGQEGPMSLEQMIATMTNSEAMRPVIVGHSRASDTATTANAFHELIVTDLMPELANIRVPTTVLYVRAPEAPFTDEQAEALYAAAYANLRGVKLIRIPNARHFIMFDQFGVYASEVTQFLSS